jgi:hypothetical protein
MWHPRRTLQAPPATRGPDETATPWNVRETLLAVGRSAARRLRRWQDALDLNAGQIASKRERGASAADTSRSLFNDYGRCCGWAAPRRHWPCRPPASSQVPKFPDATGMSDPRRTVERWTDRACAS